MNKLKCQRGQGLIEYLIIVAMMAIATIGVVRMLNQTVTAQFSNVTNALQGGKKAKIKTEAIQSNIYKKKDMGNFLNGSSSKNK